MRGSPPAQDVLLFAAVKPKARVVSTNIGFMPVSGQPPYHGKTGSNPPPDRIGPVKLRYRNMAFAGSSKRDRDCNNVARQELGLLFGIEGIEADGHIVVPAEF